jgi:integrase
MPFADVPEFLGRLRAMQGIAARASEFAILTAARSGEVLGARWEEIDFQNKLWTVPPERNAARAEEPLFFDHDPAPRETPGAYPLIEAIRA